MLAAHEAALACAEDGGAWLPLLPIKSFWGSSAGPADPEGMPSMLSFTFGIYTATLAHVQISSSCSIHRSLRMCKSM